MFEPKPQSQPQPQDSGAEDAIFKAMLDEVPVGVYRIDRAGCLTYANLPLLKMLGITADGALGRVIYDFFPASIVADQRKDDQWVMATGQSISQTPATGERQYRRETKSPIRNALGVITGLQAFFWDATELMRAHIDLKESEVRFNLFMDTLPAAAFMKDENSTAINCNRYMRDIIGAQVWMGKNVHDIFPKELAEQMIADDRRSLKAGYTVLEEDVPCADGKTRSYQTHKFAIPRPGMTPLLGGIAIDMSERKHVERELQALNARLEILATTDHLSGLSNRRRITEVLNDKMDQFNRYGRTFSIILLDIDHFKLINDSYGHQAGDRVISELGALLMSNIRTVDAAGRWGGEEFLIVCPESNQAGALELAELMRQRIENHDFGIARAVTASCGLAVSRPGLTVNELIKATDDALYRAKELRNSVASAPFEPGFLTSGTKS